MYIFAIYAFMVVSCSDFDKVYSKISECKNKIYFSKLYDIMLTYQFMLENTQKDKWIFWKMKNNF